MEVTFWGVRGSIATPGTHTLRYGGNTTCVEVRYGNQRIIIDAGSGIRELGDRLLAIGEVDDITILISHTHWDHLQGFPFFVPAYRPETRLHLSGPTPEGYTLEEVLRGQMAAPYFPVNMHEMGAQLFVCDLTESEFDCGDLHIATLRLNHPGVCLGYRLEHQGIVYAHLCDTDCFPMGSPPPASATPGSKERLALIDKRLIEFSKGADLLVVDSQYDAMEYAEHLGWGHACVDDVAVLAREAEVHRLRLVHHDPRHDDATMDRIQAHAQSLLRDTGIDCLVGREGMTCVLTEGNT